MKRVRALLIVFIMVMVSGGVYRSSPAGEQPVQLQKEQGTSPETPAEKKATLTFTKGPENTIGINLVNSVPVRGVQFTLSGVTMTEVRTTARTEGFLAKFNEVTGIVILVSTAADEIPPGAGSVVDVIGKEVPGSEITLSSVMIVDANKTLIE